MKQNQILEDAVMHIRNIVQRTGHALVAIDGRCASGKTTLAGAIQQAFPDQCHVFHMDDFFLRPVQRTPERYAEPGGNVDRERFMEEVLQPLLTGTGFSYTAFDCHTMTLRDSVWVEPRPINIVEGTYSCHPALAAAYDLRIFLTVPSGMQLARIRARNGAQAADMFAKRWIPLEEAYFHAFAIQSSCDICAGEVDGQ